MRTEEFIEAMRRELLAQLEQAEDLRSVPLSVLQERPYAGSWCVMEVLEHMNLSSGVYHLGLKKVLGDPNSKLRVAPEYGTGFMGGFSAKAMRPKSDGRISWRMKTMAMFEPRTAATKGWAALDDFQAILRGLLELLEQAERRGLEGEKVTSSLGPILRFKVGDAFAFPIAHQARHMLQVERTLKLVQTNTGRTA